MAGRKKGRRNGLVVKKENGDCILYIKRAKLAYYEKDWSRAHHVLIYGLVNKRWVTVGIKLQYILRYEY